MTGDKLLRDTRGLTLMELLVVMGVFSLTVTMTSAIFIQANRAQRRVLALTNAQADLRFALETIVREVRGGQIDYATYEGAGGIQVPSDNLRVRSAGGNLLKFYAETNPTICGNVPKCLAVNVDGVAQSLSSRGVALQNVTFFITPQSDPFTIDAPSGLYKASQQPLVTVALKVRTIGGNQTEVPAVVSAQTTVAARTYVR